MVVHDRTRLIGSLFLFFFCFGLSAGSATESDGKSKSLADETFVVETTDQDAADSLDRISGKIDAGILAPEYTYKSKSHGRAGALENSEAHDRYDT